MILSFHSFPHVHRGEVGLQVEIARAVLSCCEKNVLLSSSVVICCHLLRAVPQRVWGGAHEDGAERVSGAQVTEVR